MPTKRKPRSTRQKVSGALKQTVESRKAPTALLGDIQQYAIKRALEDTSRRQDIIHPSEVAKEDWCPRQTAYRIGGIAPSNAQKMEGYHLLTIFQEGHDIHTKWQSWLAEMGRLWGEWKCPVCGHTAFSTGAPYCTECFHEHNVNVQMDYAEVPLDAESDWLIHGHADGAIPDIESFIEIKSIGLGTIRMEEPSLVKKWTVKTEDGKTVVDYDSLWKNLKRPLKSHRKQATLYLAIAKHLGWPYKRMIFIYENKANQQTKEFTVGLDEDLADELIDAAKDIKWAVEHDIDLPRPVGFERDKKPCKECPWRDWCWAGEEETDAQPHGDEKRDTPDGARVPRSKAKTRTAADPDAGQAEERLPRSARRSHRTERQRPDDADDRVHEVGGVPQRPGGGSRGGRKVRRTRTRQGSGDQVLRLPEA